MRELYFSLQRLSSNLYVNFQTDFDVVRIGNVQNKLITRDISKGAPQVDFVG